MNLDPHSLPFCTQIGRIITNYSARGIPSFSIELSHPRLHKHRIIRGPDPSIVNRKALIQAEAWDELWEKNESRQRAISEKAHAKELAEARTQEAQDLLDEPRKILLRTLEIDDTVDWDLLQNHEDFPVAPPKRKTRSRPSFLASPPVPDWSLPAYQPKLNILDKILSIFGRKPIQKIEAANEYLEGEQKRWRDRVIETIARNNKLQEAYEAELKRDDEAFKLEFQAWQAEKDKYLREQAELNRAVEEQRESYERKDPDAILNYCELVLSNSSYPSFFPQEFDLQFDDSIGLLAVDYLLPSIDDLPTITDVRYIASRNDFSKKHLSDSQKSKLYDEVIFQTSLRTVHELFEADTVNAISSIVLNGHVNALNNATGHVETSCILSLHTAKDEFQAINLSAVEPKNCFKQLKGVAAAKLSTMTAVPPLVIFSKDDNRFVSSYNVSSQLDEGVNLASMDWEDFEHLIRELFELELATTGGEVKVTQASRDGGVDAVAFDPDPIRGGKIVIQAKRYTNTVGVSAVRDLYGTVHNEGATKGTLVTTSDYGPDAYEFARNKPLTLLNGGNLLFLLQKHGQKARIDLREAKTFFDSQK